MDYNEQLKHNENTFKKGAQMVRPDIYALMNALDETHVDFTLVLSIIYALERVATGSKYGNVTIYIENGTATFVKGEESKKVNLSILRPQ